MDTNTSPSLESTMESSLPGRDGCGTHCAARGQTGEPLLKWMGTFSPKLGSANASFTTFASRTHAVLQKVKTCSGDCCLCFPCCGIFVL